MSAQDEEAGGGADYDAEAAEEVAQSSVADPEEFNQTQRLRAVNEIRKEAGETIQATMTQLRTDTDFDVSDRQQILRAAIMRYLTNIEWLVHKADERKLLSELVLGRVTLTPPTYLQELVNDKTGGYPRVIGSPELTPQRWTINGFNDYLTAPETFTAEWAVRLDTRHKGPQEITETESTYMPAHVSFNAFRMANKFLSEQGVDVELAEDQHRGVVDNELMEEIEQWRKHNIK